MAHWVAINKQYEQRISFKFKDNSYNQDNYTFVPNHSKNKFLKILLIQVFIQALVDNNTVVWLKYLTMNGIS